VSRVPAILVLKDGTIFRGHSIGAEGLAVGEVVFNTATTGYQEILTDPSYCRQLVTLTYPHIGNTGANTEDAESGRIYAAGLVIRDIPLVSSNWRKQWTLSDYLQQQGYSRNRGHRHAQADTHAARWGGAGRLPDGGPGG
jgi:carbamoyl-phosphate synthase small subunit